MCAQLCPRPSDRRTLLLLGKTGRGKSATGNTLAGHAVFESRRGAAAITATCAVHEWQDVSGPVRIIDTPGLFDPNLSNADTVAEIGRALELADGEIHGMLLVFNGDDARFTAEEQFALRLVKLLFGPKLLRFTVIVFTRADCFDGATQFEEQVLAPLHLSDGEELAGLDPASRALRGCLLEAGRRWFLIDNTRPKPNDQGQGLLEVVDRNLAEHGGIPYTRADFAAHSASLTDAQRAVLSNPLTPEKQQEATQALAGEVTGLKGEVSSLRSLISQMTTEQNAMIQQVVAAMQMQQQQRTLSDAAAAAATTKAPT